MIKADTLERYLMALINGDRKQARTVIEETLQTGTPANMVYTQVVWPIMVQLEKLNQQDKITPVQEHLAVRINRTIVDQLQNKLPRKQQKNRKITICCSEEEIQELGAQITADLFESDGWEVKFLGGGLNNEDILSFVNTFGPDVLLIYGTAPQQAPGIRTLIDRIKEVNAWQDMKIMVSGGLFNRAEGLWQEVGADMFAPTAEEAVELASGRKEMVINTERELNQRKRKTKKKQAASA